MYKENKMYIGYYNIDKFNISNEEKKTLENFIELIEEYECKPDKLKDLTHEELSNIFKITKSSPKLQIEIWSNLHDEIVKDSKNLEIFKEVLENKFGNYINEIDKKALVELLNSSRYRTRIDGRKRRNTLYECCFIGANEFFII